MKFSLAPSIVALALVASTGHGAPEVVRVRAGTNWPAIKMANEAAQQFAAGRDMPEVRRKLDAAIAADPSYWPAYFTRAELNMREHKYAAAVADATKSLEGRSWFPPAALIRAIANGKLGKIAESIRETEHVISLQPKGRTYPDALNHLAWIRATCPDPAFRNGPKAIDYAKRACALTLWKDAASIDTLAAAYAEAGDFDSAVRFEEQAIARGGLSADLMNRLRQNLAAFKQRRPVRS
jgi:tetratricopeptide (TPR) repeat protein